MEYEVELSAEWWETFCVDASDPTEAERKAIDLLREQIANETSDVGWQDVCVREVYNLEEPC